MPLARIFTRNPERTADLSSQLRQQGYNVEVARPDQTNLAPADLEIEFEICERSDVLERAAGLASELGADVAVAPGVLQMASRSVIEPAITKTVIATTVVENPVIDTPKASQPIAATPLISEPVVGQRLAAEPIASQPVISQPVTAQPVVVEPVAAEIMSEDVLGLEQHETPLRDPERDFEAAFAPVIEMKMPEEMKIPAAMQASHEVIDVPVMEEVPVVMEPEQMPPVAFLEESHAPKPLAAAPVIERYPVPPVAQRNPVQPAYSEPARSADPMPYLAQLTPFTIPASRPSENIREDKKPAASRSSRPQEPRQIPVRGKKVLEDGARVAAHTWAGALALAASTSASVRDHFEEYKKRAQVRSAESRAAHAARLLDLEQRRTEAHQRAAELELAREQAAARLMELVRQREPGLPPDRLRESMPFEPVVPAQSQPMQSKPAQSFYERPPMQERKREASPVAASSPEPAAKSRRTSIASAPVELWRSINPPLRSVLTGAAAVTALFIMGIALGLFHSRPQMASTPNHASSGVTVQPGGVTLAAGQSQAAQPVAAQPITGAARSVQPATAAQVAKPSPRVGQARLVAGQSEKQIGDDVVIRRYSRPAPTQKPKQAGQQAGLKHFSDLDN